MNEAVRGVKGQRSLELCQAVRSNKYGCAMWRYCTEYNLLGITLCFRSHCALSIRVNRTAGRWDEKSNRRKWPTSFVFVRASAPHRRRKDRDQQKRGDERVRESLIEALKGEEAQMKTMPCYGLVSRPR